MFILWIDHSVKGEINDLADLPVSNYTDRSFDRPILWLFHIEDSKSLSKTATRSIGGWTIAQIRHLTFRLINESEIESTKVPITREDINLLD